MNFLSVLVNLMAPRFGITMKARRGKACPYRRAPNAHLRCGISGSGTSSWTTYGNLRLVVLRRSDQET